MAGAWAEAVAMAVRRKRFTVVLAAGVMAVCCAAISAAPAGAAGAASSSPYPVTTSDPVTPYKTTHDVPITMSDGVRLDSDEYVPTKGCPCPVVLVQTPYRKSDAEVAEAIPYLYEHGYAEIVVDVRGTGSSGGYWDSFGSREQQDGAELVAWAARQPFSDGKVGLAGVSYAGINQLLTAEQPGMSGPSSPLKAIFPIVSMADAYRDVTFAGGNVDAGFIPLWLGLVTALGIEPPDNTASQPAVALNVESQHLYDVSRFTAPAIGDAALGTDESMLPSQAQTFPDQAYDGPFFQVRSPITKIRAVTTPAFVVGGTYDLFQRGEPVLYRALDLPPSEKKLVIGPWYHVTEGTGLTNDDGTGKVQDSRGNVIPSIDNLELAWFDHWLKGMDNGIQAFPTVEAYRLGADKWVPDTAYPASGTVGQRWYLGATGSPDPQGSLGTGAPRVSGTANLSAVSATGECSRSTSQWTAGLPEEVPVPDPCANDSVLTEAQGLTFTSPVFKAPYTISGPIEADLYMSSTAADSSLVATISDVSPGADGAEPAASDVTAGTLLASLRQVTRTQCGSIVLDCSVYLDGQSIEPWHPYTQQSQQPLSPGAVYELQVEIFPTSATFEPGHQLRLTITTSDLPHETETASTTASSAGVDTFYFGPSHPSSIYLGTTGS
jgi:putative CocE/NonD family hydrolase